MFRLAMRNTFCKEASCDLAKACPTRRGDVTGSALPRPAPGAEAFDAFAKPCDMTGFCIGLPHEPKTQFNSKLPPWRKKGGSRGFATAIMMLPLKPMARLTWQEQAFCHAGTQTPLRSDTHPFNALYPTIPQSTSASHRLTKRHSFLAQETVQRPCVRVQAAELPWFEALYRCLAGKPHLRGAT